MGGFFLAPADKQTDGRTTGLGELDFVLPQVSLVILRHQLE